MNKYILVHLQGHSALNAVRALIFIITENRLRFSMLVELVVLFCYRYDVSSGCDVLCSAGGCRPDHSNPVPLQVNPCCRTESP